MKILLAVESTNVETLNSLIIKVVESTDIKELSLNLKKLREMVQGSSSKTKVMKDRLILAISNLKRIGRYVFTSQMEEVLDNYLLNI